MIQSGCAPDSRIIDNVLQLKGKVYKEQCGRSELSFLLFWRVERFCCALSKKHSQGKVLSVAHLVTRVGILWRM